MLAVYVLCPVYAGNSDTVSTTASLPAGMFVSTAYIQELRCKCLSAAGANEIAASAVGLVYLFAIGPTILVKLSAPYWFHLVGYSTRFWIAAALMSCSFIIVGCSKSMTKQVRGITAAQASAYQKLSVLSLGCLPSALLA
jgi:hypothetical protein